MCLIAWNWQPGSTTPLLLIGNRDEFYARPALPMHWWTDQRVLAGQDLQAGGTWLGLNRRGCLAVLTNYRSSHDQLVEAPSRGELVAGFLQASFSAESYLEKLSVKAHRYNPFNLLLYDGSMLMGFESRYKRSLYIAPGISGVSNANFDTPWPKLERVKNGLRALSGNDAQTITDTAILSILQDRRQADDADLPSTGIALARELALSAPFIATPDYGTRACSVVRIGRSQARSSEYSFDANGATGQVLFEFTFSSPSIDRI